MPHILPYACFSFGQVTEVVGGSNPISGFFSLIHSGHSFQENAHTRPISVHASAGIVAAELASLGNLEEQSVHVSRSRPSAEGQLAWTVTFAPGEGDFPPMEAVVDGVTGTDAAVRVSTLANGVAPVRGSLSLVVSGVPGEVRRRSATDDRNSQSVEWLLVLRVNAHGVKSGAPSPLPAFLSRCWGRQLFPLAKSM